MKIRVCQRNTVLCKNFSILQKNLEKWKCVLHYKSFETYNANYENLNIFIKYSVCVNFRILQKKKLL